MEVRRIFDIIRYQNEKYPLEVSIAGKEKGEWIGYSTQDFIHQAEFMSLGLLELGIKAGDMVANISNNRPEWNLLDYGLLQIGAVHVPIYPTITEDDYIYVLNDSNCKYVFVSDQDLYEKMQRIKLKVPNLIDVFTYDKIDGARYWHEVIDMADESRHGELEKMMDAVDPQDLATLIYTSGTTGNPKGVMLTHNNMVSNVKASFPRVPCKPYEKCLSFLPLCHSFERMLTYLYMYVGVSIYYAQSIESIGEDLKEVKPHIFSTVPRLLEKVYDKIVTKGRELTGIKKSLFFWALGLGKKYDVNKSGGPLYNAQLSLANRLIFSKWREALGGNVNVIVSGAAALQVRLARVFWAAQINVLEGYGLTETSPVIAVNDLPGSRVAFGTVGPVLENVECKIAEDGEICVKGPNVMRGYYNAPEKTKEVIDDDGWFHTGDIGIIDEMGCLKITDRKKEIFKTSGGKYIAPQQSENLLKESSFIEQVMVLGEGEKYPAAFITPAWDVLEEWAQRKGHNYSDRDELVSKSEVMDHYRIICERYNKRLGKWEQIKKFEILNTEWSIEGKELTPTMKLKRRVIMEKHGDAYRRIYQIED